MEYLTVMLGRVSPLGVEIDAVVVRVPSYVFFNGPFMLATNCAKPLPRRSCKYACTKGLWILTAWEGQLFSCHEFRPNVFEYRTRSARSVGL